MSTLPSTPNNKGLNESKPYGRFLLTLLGFSIFFLGLSFTCNFILDPYGVWKNGGRRDNDRLIKAIKVSKMRPKTIFLGSSSAVTGLNPNHPGLMNEQPVYNLGLFGSNIYETRRYFEHTLSAGKLEKIILSLNFHSFSQYRKNAPGFSESRLGNHFGDPEDYISLYFSLDSLKLAIDSSKSKVYLTEKGSYLRQNKPDKIKETFKSELIEDFSQIDLYGDFQLSQSYLLDYRSIITSAKKNNVETLTYIPPIHATLFYGFITSERWSQYKSWLRSMVLVHPTWDFSGCNSVTTQSIHPKMATYFDASHYTMKVGDWLLKRMLNSEISSIPSDFGVLVTSENVDDHLNKLFDDCLAWQQENPELVEWVDNIKLLASKS